jgi:hypothetical protein
MPNQALSTIEIQTIFNDEIQEAGGSTSDTFDDGARLFTRSILPWRADVRPGDELKGGVALKAAECDISIHPYLFRTVCRNGAIVARAIQTRQVENSDLLPREAVAEALCEAVRACCVEEAFAQAAQDVRVAVASEVDLALTMLPMLSRLPSHIGAELLGQIVSRFFQHADRSRFGLMNAVTSVARDTRDPELRWRLEELGGGIPLIQTPTPSLDPADKLAADDWNGPLEPSPSHSLVGSGLDSAR